MSRERWYPTEQPPALTPAEPEAPVKARTLSWGDNLADQARYAVQIAAAKRAAADRALAYYVRCAASHGLTVDEIAQLAHLEPAAVQAMTNPGVIT